MDGIRGDVIQCRNLRPSPSIAVEHHSDIPEPIAFSYLIRPLG
jgi:hypothetical protein